MHRVYLILLYISNQTQLSLLTIQMIMSLHTLPVDLVYRILDIVNEETLFMSCFGVCKRLNHILNTYPPYQVVFHFIISLECYRYCKASFLSIVPLIILISRLIQDFIMSTLPSSLINSCNIFT